MRRYRWCFCWREKECHRKFCILKQRRVKVIEKHHCRLMRWLRDSHVLGKCNLRLCFSRDSMVLCWNDGDLKELFCKALRRNVEWISADLKKRNNCCFLSHVVRCRLSMTIFIACKIGTDHMFMRLYRGEHNLEGESCL